MQNTTQKFIATLFVFSFAVAASVLATGTFNDPTAAAPAGNVPIPIHQGLDQIKDAGLSVNTFIANQTSLFSQKAIFPGTLRGRTTDCVSLGTTSETICIGGKNSQNAADSHGDVSVTELGKMSVVGKINQGYISNTENLTGTTNLCADKSGQIVRCIDGGNGDVGGGCPAGETRLYNGNCGYSVIVDSSSFAGTMITALSGIPGFTFQGPLKYNGSQKQEGLHDDFSGVYHSITITATGPSFDPPGGAQINFYKNNDNIVYFIDCKALPAGQTITYTSKEFKAATNESISVSINTGGC